MPPRFVPLAWGLGIGGGCLLAALVSPYVPGWGVALAVPGATLIFSVGTTVIPEDELLAGALRVTVALTIGFVATTVPVTLQWLERTPEAMMALREIVLTATREEALTQLHRMWIAQGCMVPVGLAALAVRRRRRLRAAPR